MAEQQDSGEAPGKGREPVFEFRHFADGGFEYKFFTKTKASRVFHAAESIEAIKRAVREHIPAFIEGRIAWCEQHSDLTTHEAKLSLTNTVSRYLREFGMFICHPETGEQVGLFAIKDDFGGKFVLQDKKTKKRSHTTRNIRDLMPFRYGQVDQEGNP